MRVLANNPFEIPLTLGLEQIPASFHDVIEESHARFNLRHDGAKPPLALEQWQLSQVSSVQKQQIERNEVRPLATKQ